MAVKLQQCYQCICQNASCLPPFSHMLLCTSSCVSPSLKAQMQQGQYALTPQCEWRLDKASALLHTSQKAHIASPHNTIASALSGNCCLSTPKCIWRRASSSWCQPPETICFRNAWQCVVTVTLEWSHSLLCTSLRTVAGDCSSSLQISWVKHADNKLKQISTGCDFVASMTRFNAFG